MHSEKLFISILLTATLFLSAPITGADINKHEILRQADIARGNVGGIQWTVHIVAEENNRTQDQTLKVQSKNYDFLAVFIDPPRVRKQRVLLVDHNMWFMKPGLRKPVPISPRQRLLGAASYGDIAATNYSNDYEITQFREEFLDGEKCYFFDLKATNKKATYDRIKYWVSAERLVGVKAEFYTISGKLFKSATYEHDNRIVVDGHTQPFISAIFIKDALIGDNLTRMDFSDYSVKEIAPATFDLNFLMML